MTHVSKLPQAAQAVDRKAVSVPEAIGATIDRLVSNVVARDMLKEAIATRATAGAPETGKVPAAAAIGFDARAFVTAGRAIFTLSGLTTRYTFRVVKREGDAGTQYPHASYFVQLLTGPENTEDYTYVGVLRLQDGQLQLTRASRLTATSAPVIAWNWAMRRIWAGKDLAPGRIDHAGRCGRCGRLLTVPTSIASGFGPECAGKIGE